MDQRSGGAAFDRLMPHLSRDCIFLKEAATSDLDEEIDPPRQTY